MCSVSFYQKKSRLSLPLASENVSAGFPSPADDYMDVGIDLNEELIKHPASTFFLRVSGHSMTNAGIYDGDLLVIDRGINPIPGQIVIAILDGCFTLKKLTRNNEKLYLEAESPNYPSIEISTYECVQIWGVAIYNIHQLSKISRFS
ncbi:translesion error-prone DNA polymerase V autoproteolytic subunit [Prochlorococcus sp. MIT 1223]|uniref:LexA family protein n=1 Tax=Prochlorococcus sp. MIT 1223 TaxID=3096217 RepID=UPI002A75EF35|nr:translesion error-prone DNA polymerase V autoproteolytic subunit [Prochlorococcus sp. MIT 1223]